MYSNADWHSDSNQIVHECNLIFPSYGDVSQVNRFHAQCPDFRSSGESIYQTNSMIHLVHRRKIY